MAVATNGGFVKINNHDHPDLTSVQTRYYTGASVRHTVVVNFDFVPPAHCSTTGCNITTYLDVGPAYTKNVRKNFSSQSTLNL